MTTIEKLIELLHPNFLTEKEKEFYLELEKEQLHKAWKAAEQNMRSQFSSSNYKNLTFDEYYETKT